MSSALALTLHGIDCEALGSSRLNDPFISRYMISGESFCQMMRGIPPHKCSTVSDVARKEGHGWIVPTFDDGFVSDSEVAFPVLLSMGLKATFFVTVGNIGMQGYCGIGEIRGMAEAGMEIGSHGLTHRHLTTLPADEAVREIRESKSRLEGMLGMEVASFAAVGGDYRRWMYREAFDAGYKAFATMVPGITRNNGGQVLLKRNHIQRHHDGRYMARLLNGDPALLLANSLRYYALLVPKRVAGLDNYDLAKKALFHP